MPNTENGNLVGRCGLYCGACVIYRAERDDPKRRQKLADHFKCAVDKVRCNGCGALTPECWGYECEFLVCLRERGFEYCHQCPDYDSRTCEKYEKFANAYLEEDGVDLRENLSMISSGLVDEWLKASRERYICQSCQGSLVTGDKNCHHCGADAPG